MATTSERLTVNKTYKLYIHGAFPRTESGRADPVLDGKGKVAAQVSRASRKDLRNAVVAARAAAEAWAARPAYNRSQILYRIAEMLEGRAAQIADELRVSGASPAQARREVELSVDRLVYYAGWCDKLSAVFGSVNPVNSPHFCFSVPEASGVIALAAPDDAPLLGLVSLLAAALCGGNVVIALASERNPLPALTFAEVIHSSDVPAGVVNLLSGRATEILPQMASHRDINGLVLARAYEKHAELEIAAADNLKRYQRIDPQTRWERDAEAHPYAALAHMETKTTWHPVGL